MCAVTWGLLWRKGWLGSGGSDGLGSGGSGDSKPLSADAKALSASGGKSNPTELSVWGLSRRTVLPFLAFAPGESEFAVGDVSTF